MYAPRMNPYLPRPPSNDNSGVIVAVAIIFVLFLIGSGVAIWYATSPTPSPTSGNGGDGGDSPPPPSPSPRPPKGRLTDKQLEQVYQQIYASNKKQTETCDSNAKPLKYCSSKNPIKVDGIGTLTSQDYTQFCHYDSQKSGGDVSEPQICKKSCGNCSDYCSYKGSDASKCCPDKKDVVDCSQSESRCECLSGQTFDCTTGKCVNNCVCQGGTPLTGDACGPVLDHTINRCAKCDPIYIKETTSKKNEIACIKQCDTSGRSGATPGTCQGVKNPGENNSHDKYSTCCLKTVSEDGNPVDTYVCCGHGCAKPDSDGNGRGCK